MGSHRVGHDWNDLAAVVAAEIIMFFIFKFVNMVYHIDWFAYTEESLHPWNKTNLIMVYDLLDVLYHIFRKMFIETDADMRKGEAEQLTLFW